MKFNLPKKTNSRLWNPLSKNRIAFFITIFSISFIYMKTAEAGLISYMASLISGESVSAEVSARPSSGNSQTMNLLASAANIDPNPNKPIQTVPVHGGETLVADLAADNADSAEYSTTISSYTVRDGDTVSAVAKMFNVSVNTVIWANDLNSKSVLRSGQTLIILPVTGVAHTVLKNETVLTIAKKYNADPGDIYSFNDITSSSVISIGQVLVIPNAELAPKSVAATKTKASGALYEPVIGKVANLPSYVGYYACPLPEGRLSQALHGRNAIDLAASKGARILAAAGGTVIVSKSNGAWNGGYGNFVVLSHDNGTQTLYSHMSSAAVTLGQTVTSGQKIGYIGSTGLSTGPHLHFEIRGAKNTFVNGCN